MITSLYFLTILIIGFAYTTRVTDSDLERAALSPAITFLFFGTAIFFFNLLNININHTSVRVFYFSLLLLSLIIAHGYIWNFILKVFKFYQSQSPLIKTLIIIILIGFISLLIRAQVRPQWGEDAKRVWVGKALEWIQYQKLYLSDESVKDLAIWADYPLLHKVTIMFHILVLPLAYKYSSNVTDYLYLTSLFLLYLYVFKSLGLKNLESLFAAFISLFIQRQLLAFNGASLAEFNIAYLYPLSFFTLKNALEKSDFKRFLLAGFFLGMISITKNEGIYRVFFLIVSFGLFYFKKTKLNVKNIVGLVLPLVFLMTLNKLNMHTDSSKNIWIDNSKFNLALLGDRIIYVFKAMYYSMAPKGIFKSSWIIMTFLSLFTLVKVSLSNHKYKKLFQHISFLYLMNWSFDHLPTLLIQPGNFAYRNNPAFSGVDVIGRLHLQSASLFVIIGIWGIFYYKWYKLKNNEKSAISLAQN